MGLEKQWDITTPPFWIYHARGDYRQRCKEGALEERGGFKLHFSVEQESMNLEKAADSVMDVAQEDKYKPLAVLFKTPDLSNPEAGVREGAEITLYIPGDKAFKTVEGAAELWLDFADDVAKNLEEKSVLPSKQTGTDRAINAFASYRVGPNGNGISYPLSPSKKLNCFDMAGNECVDVHGQIVKASYSHAKNTAERERVYNPLGLVDHLGAALEKKRPKPAVAVSESQGSSEVATQSAPWEMPGDEGRVPAEPEQPPEPKRRRVEGPKSPLDHAAGDDKSPGSSGRS